MVDQINLDKTARNAASVRAGYEAFGRGDLGEVAKNFDPAIRWHLLLPGPLGGDYVGKEQVLNFLKELAKRSAGTFRMDVADVLASETQAAVDVRVTARRGEKTLDSHQVHLFRYDAERIVEVWQFVDDAAHAGFWA